MIIVWILRAVADESGIPKSKGYPRPLNNYHTLLSNEKAKKLLNWQPVHCRRDNVTND
jgi:hypothetical protein